MEGKLYSLPADWVWDTRGGYLPKPTTITFSRLILKQSDTKHETEVRKIRLIPVQRCLTIFKQ